MAAIKRLASAVFAAAMLMAVPAVSGCSSGSGGSYSSAPAEDKVSIVKSHSFCTDYPDTPLEDVMNKFVDNPVWKSTAKDGTDIITVSGTIKDVGKPLYMEISVKDDPEDNDKLFLDVEYAEYGNLIFSSVEDAWGYMSDIYYLYASGAENLTEYDADRMDWLMEICPLEEGFVWLDAPVLEVTESGSGVITGVILNQSNEAKSATINFVYYDTDGYQAGNAFDMIDSLQPGSKWKFQASILFDKDITQWEFESFDAY